MSAALIRPARRLAGLLLAFVLVGCGGAATRSPGGSVATLATATAMPSVEAQEAGCYDLDPAAGATALSPTVRNLLRATPLIAVVSAAKDEGAHWNTADGSRPAKVDPLDPGDWIYRQFAVTIEEPVRGTFRSTRVTVRLAGGVIGCDSVRYDSRFGASLAEGTQYVLLLNSTDTAPGPFVIAAWPYRNALVETSEGPMGLRELRALAAAEPCRDWAGCSVTSLD